MRPESAMRPLARHRFKKIARIGGVYAQESWLSTKGHSPPGRRCLPVYCSEASCRLLFLMIGSTKITTSPPVVSLSVCCKRRESNPIDLSSQRPGRNLDWGRVRPRAEGGSCMSLTGFDGASWKEPAFWVKLIVLSKNRANLS